MAGKHRSDDSEVGCCRVHGQSRIAAFAAGNVSTAVTDQCWRKAAAIQENQNLAVSFQVLVDRLRQGSLMPSVAGVRTVSMSRTIGGAAPPARVGRTICSKEPFRQCCNISSVGVALPRMTGISRCLALGDREVTRGIAQALLLLKRVIVFLVDNDQPGVLQRSENRRACPDHQLCGPGSCCPPGREPCSVRQPGVQQRRCDAKAILESRYQLRRQADFRHQQKRLLALAAIRR